MTEAEIMRHELPEVLKIVNVEAARETARRGEPVSVTDTVVQQNVANVILTGAGETLRYAYERWRNLVVGSPVST